MSLVTVGGVIAALFYLSASGYLFYFGGKVLMHSIRYNKKRKTKSADFLIIVPVLWSFALMLCFWGIYMLDLRLHTRIMEWFINLF